MLEAEGIEIPRMRGRGVHVLDFVAIWAQAILAVVPSSMSARSREMLPPRLGIWAPCSTEVDPATRVRILIGNGTVRDSQVMFAIKRKQRLRNMFQAFCLQRGLPFATTRSFARIDGRELYLDDTVEGSELGWLAEIVAMPPAADCLPMVAWSKSKATAVARHSRTRTPPRGQDGGGGRSTPRAAEQILVKAVADVVAEQVAEQTVLEGVSEGVAEAVAEGVAEGVAEQVAVQTVLEGVAEVAAAAWKPRDHPPPLALTWW